MKNYNRVKIFAFLQSTLLFSHTITIELDKQQLTLVDDRNQTIMQMDVSSGRYGNPTPVGVFSVLEKKTHHKSTLYPVRENGERGGADMPFMMRVDSAIAIHSGLITLENGIPFPSSHGCIRVPRTQARKLFESTPMGTKIIIKGEAVFLDAMNRGRMHKEKEED